MNNQISKTEIKWLIGLCEKNAAENQEEADNRADGLGALCQLRADNMRALAETLGAVLSKGYKTIRVK